MQNLIIKSSIKICNKKPSYNSNLKTIPKLLQNIVKFSTFLLSLKLNFRISRLLQNIRESKKVEILTLYTYIFVAVYI